MSYLPAYRLVVARTVSPIFVTFYHLRSLTQCSAGPQELQRQISKHKLRVTQDEDSRDSTLFGTLMDIQQEAHSGTDAVAQISEFERWMMLSSMVDWRTEATRQGAKLPKISEAKLKSKLKNPSFVLEHVNPLLW